MTKQRVFSGVQPTGKLHIGNYMGALKQWADHQDDHENIFCVVDLHALTIPEAIDPKAFRAKTLEVAALYLAAGIDPAKSTIFLQSHVHQHAELAWLLNCLTPLGWLYRMTQFKSKAGNNESVGTGLLDYPVLMAADILLYDTHKVPVGEDQKQHIELTRDLAQRINTMFPGAELVIPQPMIPPAGARVMGLDDPTTKMSKSIAETKKGHAIGLLDQASEIKKAIMGAVTDVATVETAECRFEHASPGVRNLLDLYQVLSGQPQDAIEAEFQGQGYGKLKKAVLEQVMATVEPFQARYRDLTASPDYLLSILEQGAERAEAIAEKTLNRVKQALGFVVR